MQALVCNQYGMPESLLLHDMPAPQPGSSDVIISVKACGVNFPDVLMIQNKYQIKPPLPFSPGGEVAGEVLAVGDQVHHVKKGQRVIALCGWGGFAEQVAVSAKRVFPMPEEMDFIDASCTLYTYGTSYHALKDRAQLKPGETLLVLGAGGGVGLAAVELGKVMGATVIAAASSMEKLAVCQEKGADHLIDYSTEDLRTRVKEITADRGVDVVYDPVGGALAEPALRSTAWKGRYLVVGFASGTIPQFPANLPLLKGCSIVGVIWGNFAEKEPQKNLENFGELLKMMQAGKIRQHIFKIYSLAESANALRDLMDRKVTGKAVVKIGTWTEKPMPKAKANAVSVSLGKPMVIQLKEIRNHAGESLGVSNWLTVSQEMINDFARATQDHQWLHVDVERAKREMPDGKTIAHGYLTLSLAAKFFFELIAIEGATSSINYGLNKARFPVAVKSGSRIRMHGKLVRVEEMPGGLSAGKQGVKLFLECTIELEGEDKPACVAELITAVF
jgi:NADPH2:quinone reductase